MVHALWYRMREPRVKKAAMALLYACATLVGVSTVLNPPTSIEGAIGIVLAHAWGALYLVGGLMGLGSVFQGWWWAERLGVYGIMLGVAIYLGVIIHLHLASEIGNRLPQYWAISITLPGLAYRLTDIWGLPYEPRG